MEGKQVAVLAPTTVLCQQHLETFEQRFEGYPVQIESLSRFRSQKDAQRILEGMASGQVDIVIGTHRLLQKNVSYRDLGLLVVDEEHRFGVAHKERLKQLKKTVDVITLTATPIPRTLQMAFTGLRDLSVINTPPADRLSIRTQVCRFDESLIREVILREVRRGGQVFFVHNRVRSIGAIAALLERILPEVKVLVAHGQMRERDLEDRMLSFMRGEADVLLCTTIVESGLDIPRANSMLINRADALGLAQLYQLRGRVGRSGRRAYAYLMIPERDALTRSATRRLEAIQDLSTLGSGFRLANMDLEIRGAGNLLGREQSGNLGAVGYETYMQLLEEAVEELRGGVREIRIDPEIRLRVPARLPDDYVSDVSQRLVLYKRLASAADDDEAAQVRDEILDRYGPLPAETRNLLEVIQVKIAARRLGVVAVDVVKDEIVLTAAETSRVDPASLVDFITRTGSEIRVTPDRKIHAPLADLSPAGLFAAVHDLFARLEEKGVRQARNPTG
jgi:transcription-repair coupling factor (superfamily II helicase)